MNFVALDADATYLSSFNVVSNRFETEVPSEHPDDRAERARQRDSLSMSKQDRYLTGSSYEQGRSQVRENVKVFQ